MKCTKCGTDNPKGKSVCKKCGNFLYSSTPNNRVPLTRAQTRARRRSTFKRTSLGFLWITLLLAGMFILLGVLVYLMVEFVLPDDFLDFIASPTTISDTTTGQTTTGNTLETTLEPTTAAP
jgi:uncharacterized membrane protein YvbJ